MRHHQPHPKRVCRCLLLLQFLCGLCPLMEGFFTKYTDSNAVFRSFPIVQQNCLGSWDVFHSLFHSFTTAPQSPLVVALQDPPSRWSTHPTFPGFMSFAPPHSGRPHVAVYVSCLLNMHFAVSTVVHDSSDMKSLEIHSPEGLFGCPHRTLRITCAYLRDTNHLPYCSVPPKRVFSTSPHLPLLLGDFNMHHPLADPLRSLTDKEYSLSAAYFDKAFETPYHLLNTPGVYTRFPFNTISRPTVLDLAFSNTPLSPFMAFWDTCLPSTGSDHVPITLTLQPPAIMLPPPTPHWALMDWSSVKKDILEFSLPPCPALTTPNALAR